MKCSETQIATLSLTQNGRQKVYNRRALHSCGGALGLCGAWHSKN